MRLTPAGTAVVVALIGALGVILAAIITGLATLTAALITALATLIGGGCPS